MNGHRLQKEQIRTPVNTGLSEKGLLEEVVCGQVFIDGVKRSVIQGKDLPERARS